MEYQVAEKFVSINGEGTKAGQPAVFIRFRGCNLSCSYCDTTWANGENAPAETMTETEILDYLLEQGIRNVTLTGGEPLNRAGMRELLELLANREELRVEIETNGSVDLAPFRLPKALHPPVFTVDYKLAGSGMTAGMFLENFRKLEPADTVKFVTGSRQDLEQAYGIMQKYELIGKCHLYFSPVFGKIRPEEIVDFMLEKKLNGVNLQLQLHKYIWAPDRRGV